MFSLFSSKQGFLHVFDKIDRMDKNQAVINAYNENATKYLKEYLTDQSDFPYVDNFLKLIPKTSSILDVGSGPGFFAKYIFDKGFQIIGIDLSQKMIEIAKENFPQINFRLMDMRQLIFPEHSFDAVLCAYSLIHIPTEEIYETLKDFKRVLNKGGYILIITPSGKPDKIISEPLFGINMFYNLFTKDRIAKVLSSSGFKVISQVEVLNPDIDKQISASIVYTIAQVV